MKLKARTHAATLREIVQQHFSLHVATRCNISRNIWWLFPIEQDIAKQPKPKTGKYVEEGLGFLVLDTMKFVACNVAKVEQYSTSAIYGGHHAMQFSHFTQYSVILHVMLHRVSGPLVHLLIDENQVQINAYSI